jgi:hypothetical protein
MPKYTNPLAPEKPKAKTYNMTAQQLDQLRAAARQEGIETTLSRCNAFWSIAALLALRDSEGFGQARLVRFFKRAQQTFLWICDGTLSYKDAYDAIRDECGIRLIAEGYNGEDDIDAGEWFAAVERHQKLKAMFK